MCYGAISPELQFYTYTTGVCATDMREMEMRQGEGNSGEEPLIVCVDLKHKLAFPLPFSPMHAPTSTSTTSSGGAVVELLEGDGSYSRGGSRSATIPAMHGMHVDPSITDLNEVLRSIGTSTAGDPEAFWGPRPPLADAPTASTSSLHPAAPCSPSPTDTRSSHSTHRLHSTHITHITVTGLCAAAAPQGSPCAQCTIMGARRASGGAVLSTHSMHSPLQEAGTPQGDAESAGQRRRVSLPGPCAVAERVRGCCHTITSGIQLLLVPVRVPSSECPYLCPRVSVDALFAFLDCALGFFPCYFLFGCKKDLCPYHLLFRIF